MKKSGNTIIIRVTNEERTVFEKMLEWASGA